MINISNISVEKIKSGEFQGELPEFYELKNVFENNRWHHETTFEHVLLVLGEYEKVIKNNQIECLNVKLNNNLKVDLLRIAILLHDISKKDTMQLAEDETTLFPGHEEAGARKANDILQRFDLAEKEKDFIISIIKYHGRPHEILGDRDVCEHLLKDLKTEIDSFYNETIILAMVDTMGSKLEKNDKEEYDFRINKYEEILKLI